MVGRSVCPSGQEAERRLLGSFGLCPVSFAVHLVVRALAGAFPRHPAGHHEGQVSTPGGRGRGSEGQPGGPSTAHVPQRPLEGKWAPSSPREKHSLQTGQARAGDPSFHLTGNTSKTHQPIRTGEKGKTRIDGASFCKRPPFAPTQHNGKTRATGTGCWGVKTCSFLSPRARKSVSKTEWSGRFHDLKRDCREKKGMRIWGEKPSASVISYFFF